MTKRVPRASLDRWLSDAEQLLRIYEQQSRRPPPEEQPVEQHGDAA